MNARTVIPRDGNASRTSLVIEDVQMKTVDNRIM